MRIESKSSGHWTDEQLIARLYDAEGDGSAGDSQHLKSCELCGSRFSGMQARHESIIEGASKAGISSAFLTEQRRRIYRKLSEPVRWWQARSLWRWASAGTAAAVLAVGFMVFNERPVACQDCAVSDAQLAQEVSSISLDTEAKPAAPLQALFE